MKSGIRLLLWMFCLLVLACSARAQIIISEFMADNKAALADENGQFPDWIESYNSRASTVNLNGWSLTDDPTHQARWFFPNTNLTLKGFMVVFADGTNRVVLGQPLHADFTLKASGEYLALLKPDGTAASEFDPTFPDQFRDISYAVFCLKKKTRQGERSAARPAEAGARGSECRTAEGANRQDTASY